MKVNTGHLTYCTNIHAGKNWTEDFDALKKHFPLIKQALSPDQPMGLGLRLSHTASLELAKEAALTAFLDWMKENGAYVFTMNGFPYGDFHHTIVKEDVHTPDWTTEERKAYTLRLFGILKQLLPEGMDGGISTSPLSYRHWFKNTATLTAARETATLNIVEILKELIAVYRETGITMHLDIEPEPDGILETGREFIDWFEQELLPSGLPEIQALFKIEAEEAIILIKNHLNLCYDVCHFAIGYEDHRAIIRELEQKGIKVGKIQISAALKAELNGSNNEKIKRSFEAFNEPTYLHQVVALQNNGELLRYPDLPEALAGKDEETIQWRAHFHVPISVKETGLLQSTQDDILTVLNIQKQQPFTHHLEVETYTWEVLPETLKLPLTQSISNELQWVVNTDI